MQGAQGSGAGGALHADEGVARVRLRGWKEIGRHFGVDERTAKRWEASRGLPVHRVPGDSRASVFAFADELDGWAARGRQPLPPDPAIPAAVPAPARRPWLAGTVMLLALIAAVAVWLAIRVAEERREARLRTADATRLATGQLAALNDQLDSPPGTVEVRAALAREATRILGAIAASRTQPAALRLEAAEGYRRLAILQNSIDRPSLRDRGAARSSLETALALIDGDASPEAAPVRAGVQIEAARQAGGGGALARAQALLDAAGPAAMAAPAGDLAREWWLARAEVASWAGDHAAARAAARRAQGGESGDPHAILRQVKALDLEAEALYYRGDLAAARTLYARALARVEAAARRWPADSRLRWGLLRQQWNLGSTLVAAGDAGAAVALTAAALAGWQALAREDPSDEAVGAWVRATRLSHGQALEAAGRPADAIPVLSDAVAERREWLGRRPADADRRRMLMKGLATLGDTLVRAGRAAEGCLLHAEAQRLGDIMAADGQLTGYDRSETLRPIALARARHCPSALSRGTPRP